MVLRMLVDALMRLGFLVLLHDAGVWIGEQRNDPAPQPETRSPTA